VVVANHDQGRVPTLHQPMVVKIVLEIWLRQENVEQMHAQVRKSHLYDDLLQLITQMKIDF